ncbi:MAG: glycosyl hydrolase family 5 [Chitinivibrionales bacterium]|nr:glycosyl hydrolase family 5 [Chitinivibrionales bacterium]MBD3397033.1 glycosyl hydrolase family 5 [Chitinivibrionales bacterium]
MRKTAIIPAAIAAAGLCAFSRAARLTEVRVVDNEHIMVSWKDGYIDYRDDGQGPCAYTNICTDATPTPHGSPLNTGTAQLAGTYVISSSDDGNYGSSGKAPSDVWRRAKVCGATQDGNHYFLDHTVFLKLPHALTQGASYELEIDAGTNTDKTTRAFTFDIFSSITDAIHVSRAGYNPRDTVIKSADLYMWLGDGGHRDYSPYEGNNVILYNTETESRDTVGTVVHWKDPEVDDVGWGRQLIKSGVWNCDFSSFDKSGTYRLAVEGVGCSRAFEIRSGTYYEPFKNSVRGYFYMRIGQDSAGLGEKGLPVPRRPLYIPDQDPPGFTVYLTTLYPWGPDWSSLGGGDKWDVRDWSAYKKPGAPTNPNAYGGHSDALDWDRHCGHVSNIWDLLLPYYLSDGKIDEDNLAIAESGNGVPDVIDEARNEVDFWLRLRDGAGYCVGLNNPGDGVMYQAAARPWMAWANAANCAMLADCYRIAGRDALSQQYTDSAVVAYTYANSRSNPELDVEVSVGDADVKGRDLKMMAAAFLYNLTGETAYEDAMKDLCIVTGDRADIADAGGQIWGIAAYLNAGDAGRTVHYSTLLDNMKATVIYRAKQRNCALIDDRPSRRATAQSTGWWQSAQTVHLVCMAHSIAASRADKDLFKKALLLEAEYGLGRNPLNRILMTGEDERFVKDIYTSGQNDGTPGQHPGHTPYMNAEDWGSGWWGGRPSWMCDKGYPAWGRWPYGEALWPVRYNYSNSEFTPRQTMRGKHVLLGYLYSLSDGQSSISDKGARHADPHAPGMRASGVTRLVPFNVTLGARKHRVPAPAGASAVRLFAPDGRMVAKQGIRDASADFPHAAGGVYLVRFFKNGSCLHLTRVVSLD